MDQEENDSRLEKTLPVPPPSTGDRLLEQVA
jgi:hypothetical protein